MSSKECYDHLGNRFDSLSDMCKYWEVERNTYGYRIKSGWSVEEALTKKDREKTAIYVDHLGNEFKSIKDMCNYWGVRTRLYHYRIQAGYTLEEALTGKNKIYVDHLGNKYSSLLKMCKAWGVDVVAFKKSLEKGISLKEALESYRDTRCTDHLGNVYDSKQSMCKAYGITYGLLFNRISKGMSLEQALTTPLMHKGPEMYAETVAEICKLARCKGIKELSDHFNKSDSTVRNYIKNGIMAGESTFDIYKKLMHKPDKRQDRTKSSDITYNHNKVISDGFGNTYKSMRDAAKTYSTDHSTFMNRVNDGVEVCVALVVQGNVKLKFIGLDRRARYILNRSNNTLYTARELVAKFRPDLIETYDKHNPTGKYIPYRLNKEDAAHE